MSEEATNTKPFLSALAELLLNAHGDELKNVAIVLPNQRAGLFLRNELVSLAGKAMWSPDILTMDRLMKRISGLQAPDETGLLLELYKVYKGLDLKQHDSFHDFMGWGSIALKHFNEVDAYLVDRDHFYNDIKSFEEIEAWSLREDNPLSQNQELMVERWHLHGRLHAAFVKHLEKFALGTNGLIERTAVAQLRDGSATLPWSKVWFAGMNALTAAEVKVMDLLDQAGKLGTAWESDLHFYNDSVHSAGLSLRKHIAKWGPGSIAQSKALREQERAVTIAHVPTRIGMVRYVVQHLLELQQNNPDQLKKTTVVLADTELITPFLDALPEDIGAVNVTMSIPLRKVPLTGALSDCLSMNAQYVERDRIAITRLIDFLNNPVIKPHINDEAFEKLKHSWRELNLTVLPVKELQSQLVSAFENFGNKLCEVLFEQDALQMPKRLQAFIDSVKGEEGSLLNEQAYQLAKTVKSLRHIAEILPSEESDIRNILKLWRKLIGNAAVGLYGEPLQGLQVMGLLETRAIPLENVILFPANEGHLPPSAFERSFIPFDVRRAFNLPMRSDADAVITYHFYRALANSKRMLMLVDTSDTIEANEPSRFVDQLKFELDSKLVESQTTITEFHVQAPTIQRDHPILEVAKTEQVLDGFKKKLQKGLSPSALNSYLSCPLDFYYKYVLGLRDDEAAEQDIGMNTIGNIVHKVIEDCYAPPNTINANYLTDFVTRLDAHFESSISENKAKGFLDHPRNKFPLHMAKESIRAMLKQEATYLKQGGSLTVEQVEEWIDFEHKTSTGIPYKIGGFADRIETRNGQLRVVDLKTGSVYEKDLELKDLSFEVLEAKPKAVQLLCYAWIYLNKNRNIEQVSPTILSARKSSTFPGITLKVNGMDRVNRDQLAEISNFFEAVINQMLDPAEVLRHNPDSKYCSFCIAQRETVGSEEH